jgi:hypothetical protein
MMRLDAGSNRQVAPSGSHRNKLRPLPRLERRPEGSPVPRAAPARSEAHRRNGREFEHLVDELRGLDFRF